MKKIKLIGLATMMVAFALMPMDAIHGEDFASDEAGWQQKCSASPSTAECGRFREYLSSKVSDISSQIDDLQGNIEKTADLVKSLDSQLDYYNKSIEINEADIRTYATKIEALEETIATRQKEIDKRDELIKKRMLAEQSTLGTNIDVEIIMGASDLVDMIRKVSALQKITESDQKEIDTIKEEKQKLNSDKAEQEQLKTDSETKKAENEESRDALDTLKQEQERLLSEYRKQEATLAEQKRSVQVDLNTIRNNIISDIPSNIDISNNGFVMPVQSGYLSAGTWYYPDGGAHLGMDKATGIGTPVYAPGDGIILYANNPVSSNSGYLGNWSGYPQGGGNTIHMLTQVNGVTYAISFFHLSQEGFAVSRGQQVSAGQQLALTGNSGNTTGPHCHIEVINLGSMSVADAVAQFQRTADFAWGNGWGENAVYNNCSNKGAPCRIRPETVFS